MKILSWNVNGLRSVHNKGVFLNWVKKEDPDIICLQEIKAQKNQIPNELHLSNYNLCVNQAEKKGYSGVLVYSKEKPIKVREYLGLSRFDNEGRLLWLSFKDFDLLNLYIPHGGRQKENLKYKLSSYSKLLEKLNSNKRRNIILAGDFNIAHNEIDLERPKSNLNNIMFTPEERSQLDGLINLGFIDSFRKFHKKGGNYTWWPYYRDARNRNLGWRIDYIFCSKNISSKLDKTYIQKDVFGSDHCPIGIDIKD